MATGNYEVILCKTSQQQPSDTKKARQVMPTHALYMRKGKHRRFLIGCHFTALQLALWLLVFLMGHVTFWLYAYISLYPKRQLSVRPFTWLTYSVVTGSHALTGDLFVFYQVANELLLVVSTLDYTVY